MAVRERCGMNGGTCRPTACQATDNVTMPWIHDKLYSVCPFSKRARIGHFFLKKNREK
jgi:hypothetical protein